ncbi:TIGR03767 family metallophosphoesterase [Umezawaea endophytica]|uniref:TIGR03767 family metallophosphoesterase n=1 Tax=Umezawaea endophytica TaxID=1654476 RepID=A0A9X2VVY4_9PSEU|nr:TIGR03767 family metallophosphoesterase [Umezawaea endophytica]MCS7483858.1 TIGR03767 family metallophosphoesterase [Umezawaea endophytica]
MGSLNRRGFFRAAGVAGAGVVLGAPPAWARGGGTTLDVVATPVGAGGYRRLAAGPGWPVVVRGELATANPKRVERRKSLACFVQFTDMHSVDAQSPARFEYLHPLIRGSAHRSQELFASRTSAALVRRVNGLRGGPFTGRPVDFVMTTGDNTDNHQSNEMRWYLDVLNGGVLTPNSGDPHRYEGVHNSGSELYWHPESAFADRYRAIGFPVVPGLLDASIRPFASEGLRVPWYSTFGNHDSAMAGTLPDGLPLLDGMFTGDQKITGFDDAMTLKLVLALVDPHGAPEFASLLKEGVTRTVTPDARRRPFTTAEFVRAHLHPRNTGPGPVGHGFTADNADGIDVFYKFRIAPGVTGVSLDTTSAGGYSEGAIGLHQYQWLENVLRRGSSRYYDVFGRLVRKPVTDERFVLFSHHTSGTMTNTLPEQRRPLEPRLTGDALVALLQRYPNVLAWVNGHTHTNAITAHGHATPERAFWEINTAAHVDYPQHARVIEIADNGDGTLSLFTTLIEVDAPYEVDYDDFSATGLASLGREFAFNDLHANPAKVGTPLDRNTELLLATR